MWCTINIWLLKIFKNTVCEPYNNTLVMVSGAIASRGNLSWEHGSVHWAHFARLLVVEPLTLPFLPYFSLVWASVRRTDLNFLKGCTFCIQDSLSRVYAFNTALPHRRQAIRQPLKIPYNLVQRFFSSLSLLLTASTLCCLQLLLTYLGVWLFCSVPLGCCVGMIFH